MRFIPGETWIFVYFSRMRADSARWYRKAADAGNAQGMNNLGAMYTTGTGVAKDAAVAVRWYRKTADAGDQDAKDSLKRLGH